MSTRLYVGNLAFEVTAEELRALFEEAGKVEDATIGLGPPAGQARGFGYVQMSNDDEATRAVTLLHGREFHGRKLNVKKPAEPESGSRFRKNGAP